MRESLRASGFFVLRTPLLPLDELDRLRAEPAYWRSLASRPEVIEALYLASPGLAGRLGEADADHRVAASVVAYLVRMCARATPFGLFAGCAVGAVGDSTALTVDGPAGTARHSRPDTEVLTALVDRLLADPQARSLMVVVPNSSRYHAAGAVRLIQSRVREGRRSHHLVVVEDDAPLRCALSAATGGASVARIVESVARQSGVESDEARAYVDAMIDAQVLTPVAEPAMTGAEPVVHVARCLAEQGLTDESTALTTVSENLARLDAAGVGNPPAAYRAVVSSLVDLVPGADEARLIQVDLHRAGSGLTLGRDEVAMLADGVAMLHRLAGNWQDPALRRFKDAFLQRYEDREVALMEALDEEMGIGFAASTHPAADESPLLAGIDLGGPLPTSEFTPRDAVLLDLVMRAHEADRLELDANALDRLAVAEPLPLPDALAVVGSLLADGGVEICSVTGPSGAQLLGRFCHGDPRLNDAVRAHLRAEEALAPGVVLAEIVHLPKGRVGNVLARPLLREHELVLLGRSGAAADRQLCVDELTVRLVGDRLALYSPRLDAEIRPRLTSAHDPASRSFGVYRFLAALQSDGVAGELEWDWGALSCSPALPRVTAGRLVLARARWRLSAGELDTVAGPDAAAGWAALTGDRGLPGEFVIADGDNRLYVDTASPALIAAAAKVLCGRVEALLEEVLPTGVAVGQQGRFAHELVVPFIRRGEPAPAPRPWRAPRARRSFAPGSQWLYLKVYTGVASADIVLTGTLGSVIADLREKGVFDRWFFLRYRDPDHHLRLRLHGDPAALREVVWPALTDALDPRLADGTVFRVALDTYQRETERYGGDEGIELAERFHAADSDAVLEVLGTLEGDAGLEARWRLCLYAIDRLLGDAGFDLRRRRDWARRGAADYRREYPNAPGLESTIARRWRAERAETTALLDDTAEHRDEPGRRVFRRRSEVIAPLLAELAERDRRGVLTVPIGELLASFGHLHATRLFRWAARTHELILLSFLDRHYTSEIARGAR